MEQQLPAPTPASTPDQAIAAPWHPEARRRPPPCRRTLPPSGMGRLSPDPCLLKLPQPFPASSCRGRWRPCFPASSESVQSVRTRSTTLVRLRHGFVLLPSGISGTGNAMIRCERDALFDLEFFFFFFIDHRMGSRRQPR